MTETQSNKTVLITGAGSGIGRATAQLFAEHGWQVFAGVRDPQAYAQTFSHHAIELIKLDVTQPDTLPEAISRCLTSTGKLDVVVNNAGYGLFGAFEQFTPQEVQQQYQVNLFGVMNMCRAVIPVMRRQQAGCIVNISSMGGRFVVPYYGVYNSTKYAVEGFSEGLFYELLPFHIRVKVVEPGAVHTDFYSRSKKEGTAQMDTTVYSTTATKLWNQYNAAGATGLAPKQVAQVIYKAATDQSRRMRYVAGVNARVNVYFFKFLPHQWAMRVAEWMTLGRTKS